MSQRDRSDTDVGLSDRVRRAVRGLWEFVHGFHQGHSQVRKMGPPLAESETDEDGAEAAACEDSDDRCGDDRLDDDGGGDGCLDDDDRGGDNRGDDPEAGSERQ